MAVIGSHSGTASAVDSISDLDGFTIRDYSFPASSNYAPLQDDEFGFDPPQMKPSPLSNYQVYSPPDDFPMSEWPEFERSDDLKPPTETPVNLDAYEMDKFINSTVPNANTAVARFGQMTPPRSDSADSNDPKTEEKTSPKSVAPERRKRSKAQPKEEDPSPSTSSATAPKRKRKSLKKASPVMERADSPEDNKRRQSLEKNRVAAAKCRINKKEKTEQLQRDSHEKAIENAYLKDELLRMKAEVQRMNAAVLAHANCEGCKSPAEIQAHLSSLSNDFFSQQMAMSTHGFSEYPGVNFPGLAVLPDSFFTNTDPSQMLHPPLPEFNRTAEFEVQSPMQTD